jgi:hypothetical protein
MGVERIGKIPRQALGTGDERSCTHPGCQPDDERGCHPACRAASAIRAHPGRQPDDECGRYPARIATGEVRARAGRQSDGERACDTLIRRDLSNTPRPGLRRDGVSRGARHIAERLDV